MQRLAWIEPLLESLVKGHKLMDPSAWAPPNPFLLDPLFEDLWMSKIRNLKDTAAKKGITARQMADTIMGPACIRKEFRYALWGGKLRKIPRTELLEVVTFYKDILETRAEADPFALSHAYWHSETQVKDILQNTAWQKTTAECKRIVGKISANCPALAWGLLTDFFYHRAYGVYGLYANLHGLDDRFGLRDVLMIRQFGPFRAEALWPHSKDFPINTITILGIYEDLRCDFDYINHFTTNENIPEKLRLYCVLVDGAVVEKNEELEKVNSAVIEMATTQDRFLKALDAEGQKRLTVLAKHYALKELFELVGLPWYPAQEVFQRFVGRPMLQIQFLKLKEQEREEFWRDLFDPYADFSRPEFRAAQGQLE